jgi:ABC-2 type transport system ATP-binding protein
MKTAACSNNHNFDLCLRSIKSFDLKLNNKFKDLSRGMEMKFSLAIALSHHADFIILDEPTSGMDPIFRRELLEIFSELIQDERKSILFSTHITSDLDKIADYVTFINDGSIVFSDKKDSILENWGVIKGGKELLEKEYRHIYLINLVGSVIVAHRKRNFKKSS